MMVVSVVIPTYNSGKYLVKALDSVFSQTFENYEIIVVDDGSTDNTRQIVQGYGKRVRYFYQAQSGPSHARNFGIRNAKGNLIAFLDADDVWMAEKLEKQVELFKRDADLGMVFTEHSLFDETGIYRREINKKKLLNGNLAANILLLSGVGTPTVMVKKSVFDEQGMFEEFMVYAEDDNLWIRIAANYPVRLIDEPLVLVRDHPCRLTRNKQDIFRNSLINIQLLCSRYGSRVKKCVEPVVRKKKGLIYFDQGYYHYEMGSYLSALGAFFKALKNNSHDYRIFLFIFLCLPPFPFLKSNSMVKKLKQDFRFFEGRW
ncbi:Glycosyltransferase involved in cell wall bisynthesis [Desulfocicer vacuolatum DSM 3385]|uniref:Glycosyltransferase involved in cell wall bisynthesis n=1 Tax=Desulfocicer vacuolatum DSM 3385 TaxID=1121400 RepID=A0A1W1ZNS0_9BACT|nr:glycosyltransferase family A protein [Desulfocicer vacuolatum]SMC50185.1 Glycosyltransferase involved in cell wall bisynthesis [Desulfocicer vacuolatum DSM 3385]